MKKFLLGFFIGLVFAVLAGVIVFFVFARLTGPRPVAVADNAVLVLDLEGSVPEQAPVDVTFGLLGTPDVATVTDTWEILHKAAADKRIKALVLQPRSLDMGWAKMEELRNDVLTFKKSGKPVYAFLRGAGTREYYLATAADKIYMAPEDELDVKGIRAELTYYKGTLDKLGVTMEFEHVGKYKDAPDEFTKTGPSPETLETTNQILDQYFGNLINVIAEGRKKTPEEIRVAIDQGPFVGDNALQLGLVDELIFEDDMYSRLKNQLHSEPKKIDMENYAKASVPGYGGKTKIAMITGDGEITRGSSSDGVTDSGITATGMVKTIRDVANDSSIKGVILRIDSPGGDGIASDDILHEMKQLSAKKPVIVSMSDLAASGGYFIAMTGDPILAYRNTLTGSIGVFYGKVDLHGLYDKIGLKKELLTRGKYAAIDSENAPLTPDQRDKVQREIQVFYKGFVDRVAAARKKPYDTIEPLAQGRVWLGSQAKANGLIDEIGGLDRAVELIKQKTNIPASDQISLVTYPPKRTIWDLLFNTKKDEDAELETAVGKVTGKVAGHLPWRSLAHGGVLRLMPYSLEFK